MGYSGDVLLQDVMWGMGRQTYDDCDDGADADFSARALLPDWIILGVNILVSNWAFLPVL